MLFLFNHFVDMIDNFIDLMLKISFCWQSESCCQFMSSSSKRFRYLVAVYAFAAKLSDNFLCSDRSSDHISYLSNQQNNFWSIDILDDMQSICSFLLIYLICLQFLLIIIGIEQFSFLFDPIEQ